LKNVKYIPGTVDNNPAPLSIGINLAGYLLGDPQSVSYQAFDGYLDEVRIWNRALTREEIKLNMTHEINFPQPGLVGYWKFNEGSGILASDSSGNGNDGFLVNGPVWLRIR